MIEHEKFRHKKDWQRRISGVHPPAEALHPYERPYQNPQVKMAFPISCHPRSKAVHSPVLAGHGQVPCLPDSHPVMPSLLPTFLHHYYLKHPVPHHRQAHFDPSPCYLSTTTMRLNRPPIHRKPPHTSPGCVLVQCHRGQAISGQAALLDRHFSHLIGVLDVREGRP